MTESPTHIHEALHGKSGLETHWQILFSLLNGAGVGLAWAFLMYKLSPAEGDPGTAVCRFRPRRRNLSATSSSTA